MPRPLISVVTPSFNHGRFIERTIRSVLDQRGEFDLEYRVVDGGSDDETVDILRRQGNRLVWTSEPDDGQIDAINKGLRAARGDIVGWVNSDDVLCPGALQKVATAFASHPEADWMHGRCEIIDADDRPIRRLVSRYKDFRSRRHSLENLLTENYISQMTVFWRRRLHAEVGYLDTSLNLAFDYDFWLRLAKRNAPLYVNDLIARFRWYPTSKGGANFEAQFAEDAAIAARHMPEGKRFIGWKKQAKTSAILAVYHVLATTMHKPVQKTF